MKFRSLFLPDSDEQKHVLILSQSGISDQKCFKTLITQRAQRKQTKTIPSFYAKKLKIQLELLPCC